LDQNYKQKNCTDKKDSAEAGWIKLELKGSITEVVFSGKDKPEQADNQLKPPQFIAISTEPKSNDSMVVERLDHDKPLSIKRGEGDVYIKYPYEQKYFLTLKSKYKRKKKTYTSSIQTYIP
jgi:hypothetical protein